MQIRRAVAVTVGAGFLIMSGLWLDSTASAARPTATATPSPSRTVSELPATPALTATPVPRAPSAVPSSSVEKAPPTQAPGLEVPAGDGGTTRRPTGGINDLGIAALAGSGILLSGGATVIAIRRRA